MCFVIIIIIIIKLYLFKLVKSLNMSYLWWWGFFNVAMEFSACQERLGDVLFGKNISPAVCTPPPATYI